MYGLVPVVTGVEVKSDIPVNSRVVKLAETVGASKGVPSVELITMAGPYVRPSDWVRVPVPPDGGGAGSRADEVRSVLAEKFDALGAISASRLRGEIVGPLSELGVVYLAD